jgi:alkanesulfonate monooxygenase
VSALLEYKAAGVTQFLFLGWPDDEEMRFFGREVLPVIRKRERSNGRFAIGAAGGTGSVRP